MNLNIFSECLSNKSELELGRVHLKYFGVPNLPCLMTIYEIIHPIDIAYSSINENINELREDSLGNGAVKGLLALGLSNFETMLGDLLKKYLSFYPQKLSLLKAEKGTRQEKGEYKVPRDIVNGGELLWSIITKEVDKVFYGNIKSNFDLFYRIFAIKNEFEDKDTFAQLVEIKETRNLLLHNNLYVNEQYLFKTEAIKRETEIGKQLTITPQYAVDSLCLIQSIIESIKEKIIEKYGKFTLLQMLQKLWSYTFKPHIKFEDHFVLNIEKDIYDGPFKESKYSLSSSEMFFLQVWKSQRFGSGIDNFALVHFTNAKQIAFLVEVFGNLRLTYW